MSKSNSHRELAVWRKALDLAEQVYRLTGRFPASEAPRLTRQAVEAVAAIPVHLAQAHARKAAFPGDAARLLEQAGMALLQTETCLLLAVRLGYLKTADLAPALALMDEITTLAAGPAPATSPSALPEQGLPAAPAPAAPPGGVSAPAPEPQKPPAAPASGAAETASRGVDRLIIDGSNYLGRAAGYTLGDPASRERLLLRLQDYGRKHPAHRITIFFDGQHVSRRTVGGVEEHVTSGQRPADDVIIDFVRTLPAADRPRSTLITDDRELAARARTQRVRVESVPWLAERLGQQQAAASGAIRREGGLSRNDVAEWERFFEEPPKRPKE